MKDSDIKTIYYVMLTLIYLFILDKNRILKHIEQHETFIDKVPSSRL